MTHVDIEMLTELKELMEDEFKNLLQTYLDDSEKHVIQIQSAINAGDANDVRGSAHSLKGSSGNLGATQLAEFCRQLEFMGRDNELSAAQSTYDTMLEEYQIVKKIISGELMKS